MKRVITSIAVGLLACATCAAQDPQTTDAQNPMVALPAHLSTTATRVQFTPEPQVDMVRGSLSFGFACDDNALSLPSNTVSDCTYSFMPAIALQRTTRLTKWDINYMPGFTMHQRLDNYDQASHRGGLDFTAMLSRHLTLRLRDSFTKTTELFSAIDSGAPSFGTIQTPNSYVLTPISQYIENTSGLDLGYEKSRRTTMGLSASYSLLSYDDVGNSGAGLIDSQNGTASAFYSYRITRRQTIGVSYVFHKLWYEQSTWTVAHSILYTHAFALSPTVTLAFFGGPDYAISNGQVLYTGTVTYVGGRRDSWSPGGGVNLAIQRERTGFVASYARRITDGGGLLGATHLDEVHSNVTRRINRNWTVDGGASYGHSQLLNSPVELPIDTVIAGGGVQHQLTRNLSFDARYAWQHQVNKAAAADQINVDNNRVAFSITYSFSKALGR